MFLSCASKEEIAQNWYRFSVCQSACHTHAQCCGKTAGCKLALFSRDYSSRIHVFSYLLQNGYLLDSYLIRGVKQKGNGKLTTFHSGAAISSTRWRQNYFESLIGCHIRPTAADLYRPLIPISKTCCYKRRYEWPPNSPDLIQSAKLSHVGRHTRNLPTTNWRKSHQRSPNFEPRCRRTGTTYPKKSLTKTVQNFHRRLQACVGLQGWRTFRTFIWRIQCCFSVRNLASEHLLNYW